MLRGKMVAVQSVGEGLTDPFGVHDALPGQALQYLADTLLRVARQYTMQLPSRERRFAAGQYGQDITVKCGGDR